MIGEQLGDQWRPVAVGLDYAEESRDGGLTCRRGQLEDTVVIGRYRLIALRLGVQVAGKRHLGKYGNVVAGFGSILQVAGCRARLRATSPFWQFIATRSGRIGDGIGYAEGGKARLPCRPVSGTR